MVIYHTIALAHLVRENFFAQHILVTVTKYCETRQGSNLLYYLFCSLKLQIQTQKLLPQWVVVSLKLSHHQNFTKIQRLCSLDS